MEPDIEVEWCAGRFTGDQAKYISGMADQGIGYYVLERPEKGHAWIKVAFRRAIDKARPEHLVPIYDSYLLKKLSAWINRNKGTDDGPKTILPNEKSIPHKD
jgi:hypothetical protein